MIISPNLPVTVSPDQARLKEASVTGLPLLVPGSGLTTPASGNSNAVTALAQAAQSQNLNRAQDNISQAVSFTQTQDAYLQIVGNALNRMGDLAQLAQDPTTSDADRTDYQSEFAQSQAVIANAAGKDFNGESLFSGNNLTVALDADGKTLTLPGVNLSNEAYTGALESNLESPSDASAALSKVQLTITQLSQDHAGIGASQSELNSAADLLAVSKENLTAMTIRIPDADAAAALVQHAQQQILVQSDTAMFAQANTLPQNALRLVP